MTSEQQKRADEYLEKVHQERAREKHMTTEEFYAQMEQSMGKPIKFIKKEEL